MNAASIDFLTPQDALFMADTLLANACTSEDAYVQQRLCSLINCVFLRVRKDIMDELRSSTSTEDQEIVHRVYDIYAERDDILALLDPLALSYQPTDGRSVKANEHLLTSLNSALLKLKSQILGEQDLGLYVPLMAKANIQARDDSLFPLIDKAHEFLEGDGQVMLLLGDSGAGKTTFNHQLELQLWKNFHVDGPIPLYINLPTIDEPDHDIVTKQLCRLDFTADQIQQLRKNRQFILICDGYDECQQLPNLYQSNQLNMPGQWRAKVFISCRSEYIEPDYRGRFQPPVSDNLQSSVSLFQEAVVAPFSTDQILLYIDQYVVSSSNPQGTSQEYVNKLNGIPGLMELVQNPFLLTLALESLPKVMSNGDQDLGKDQISRVILYDKFIEQWLEIGKLRLQESPLTTQEHKLFYDLLEDGVYEQRSIQFLKDLSITIFIKQGGNPVVQYSEQVDTHSWKSLFFSPEAGVKIFRQSSPLTRSGDRYRFIHRSWLEYFYSRVVYDPDESFDGVADVSPPPISDHPLSLWSLNSEPSVIQFLAERVQVYPDFKERLLTLIDLSKSDIQVSQAASNAITILTKAGNRFHGHDLRGIRIPGADLAAGQFDSAQFQGADLTNVNFTKSWIRLADFSGAQMDGVRFGELPFLKEQTKVWSGAFSPDGKSFAAGLKVRGINIYDTATWRKVRTFHEHQKGVDDRKDVVALAYSPCSSWLLAGNKDHTAKMWNCETALTEFVMRGHSGAVTAVAFSSSGKQVATASNDKSVRLWDARAGALVFVLRGDTHWITAVVFSPGGNNIAYNSNDGTVQIFNTYTKQHLRIYGKEGGLQIACLAYSPDGQHIISGGKCGQLQLWTTATMEPGFKWTAHTTAVMGVNFSPNNQLIASSGDDSIVKLWDAHSRVLISLFTGHSRAATGVVFSPDGTWIASVSRDNTVRIWEVNSTASGDDSQESSDPLTTVAYSPDGRFLISGSRAGTVRRYDTESSELDLVISGDADQAEQVAYSPDGLWIATCGKDKDARIWRTGPGTLAITLRGHHDYVNTMAFSPCNQWVVTGSSDKSVRFWDTRTGAPGHVLVRHKSGIRSVAFSADGLELVSGGWTAYILVWDVKTGECKAEIQGNEHGGCIAMYFAGGRRIVSSSGGRGVQLWDEQCKNSRFLVKKDTVFHFIAFSSCGQWLATVNGPFIRLWRCASKEVLEQQDKNQDWECIPVLTVRGFFARIEAVVWRPGVPEFATVCLDGSVRVWQLVEDGSGKVSVKLVWGAGCIGLVASDAVVKDVVGLDPINRKLLEQRGAMR